MTYTAICILLMCGDDLSRVNRSAITKALRKLQQPDGSFSPIGAGGENDMRFVYCAAAISYMLNDFSGVDVDKAVKYIITSQVTRLPSPFYPYSVSPMMLPLHRDLVRNLMEEPHFVVWRLCIFMVA